MKSASQTASSRRLPLPGEQMIQYELRVTTAHGEMPTEVMHPSSGAKFPAIIMFMDAPGIRAELRAMARRIAKAGYCCFLPDLYYRFGHIRLDLTRRTEAHAELYRHLGASLANDEMAADTANLLRDAAGESSVRDGGVGCIGFSIGGRFAMQAAGQYPDVVVAAVSVCGSGIVSDKSDSPHRALQGAQAELLFEFAENDAAVPLEHIRTLESTLVSAKRRHAIAIEPGTQHGYVFPMRPMYRASAAENSWKRIFDLFGRALNP
jgi:carboxymethylenebutenolidase